jgi:hypothetical protein
LQVWLLACCQLIQGLKRLEEAEVHMENRDDICERLAAIEKLLQHIIENDLKHIWKILIVILGAIISTMFGVILSFIFK